ncbi:MAG: hypothetical protein F4X71_04015 [Cenarchaeum sp. SB0662_bin_33]|nr:hypothetical protein [Cenarchaeum sp. SB0662_bin_33]
MREERFIKQDRELAEEWCNTLNISDIDGVMDVYREAIQSGILRGRTVPAVLTTSIYVWVRRNNKPITMREVADCCGTPKTVVEKIMNKLGPHPKQDPHVFVQRGFKRLNLPDNTTYQLSKRYTDLGPAMQAAIAVLLSARRANHQVNIPSVSGAVGVQPDAMRRYVTSTGGLKERKI